MPHFVTSYMKQNKSRKQTLESAQYGLEINFKGSTLSPCTPTLRLTKSSSLALTGIL